MNPKEYNQCVDLYANALHRFLEKNIRDSDVAKDLVQDTFEKLWRKLDGVHMEKAKSYLFTTAYHTMIDKIRKLKYETPYEDIHENMQSVVNPHTDISMLLHKALHTLSEVQRSVILLRDYEGHSYEEIGEIMGLNPAQVKINIYRGRLALRNYIGKLENVV